MTPHDLLKLARAARYPTGKAATRRALAKADGDIFRFKEACTPARIVALCELLAKSHPGFEDIYMATPLDAQPETKQ